MATAATGPCTPVVLGEAERFRILVEAVRDYAIYLMDPQGNVTSWNSGAARIKGYEAAEVLGRHFSLFYPPEALAKKWPDHELASALRDGRFEDEGWRVRKDGSRIWANVIITSLYDAEGNHLGFAKITRDLSERKKAEQALQAMAARLARSNRELEQFASIAAHDLQEPLRKIEAFGDRLKLRCRDQLGDVGIDYLERMRSSAARMRRLINDLLSYSRVATKARPFEPVDLSNVLSAVLSDLEGTLSLTGGTVQVGPLPQIEADPVQMHQLMINLIANGLKFHAPGRASTVRVEGKVLEAPEAVPTAQIRVVDDGIGFEPEYAERIFDVFQRLHGRQEYEGTGMGLAICRKIAERHHGTITASSTPGAGASFLLRLPLRQTQQGHSLDD